VIDLEGLAQHQGSTYGSLNRLVQPSQEQFENKLADQLHQLDPTRKIWIEDESVTIGKRLIPKPFWNQMQLARLFDLQVPVEQRIEALVQEYGTLDKEFLVACTDRIRKRLGLEQTKYAIAAIREDRMDDFIRLVLVYYDKAYRIGLNSRNASLIFPVPIKDADPTLNAREILDHSRAGLAKTDNTLV
jgi:tRNA 2-selenouridine synthase